MILSNYTTNYDLLFIFDFIPSNLDEYIKFLNPFGYLYSGTIVMNNRQILTILLIPKSSGMQAFPELLRYKEMHVLNNYMILQPHNHIPCKTLKHIYSQMSDEQRSYFQVYFKKLQSIN